MLVLPTTTVREESKGYELIFSSQVVFIYCIINHTFSSGPGLLKANNPFE